MTSTREGVTRPTHQDVQGWIVSGYRFAYVRHLVVTVLDSRRVLHHIARATDGTAGVAQIRDASRWTTKPLSTLSVGFTHSGLAALGVPGDTLAGFPTEFRQGAPQRAAKIGDIGDSAPQQWDDGMADTDRVHMIWTVHAQSIDEIRARHDELTAAFGASVALVAQYDGEAMRDERGELDDRVHFGYVDGISQPRIEGFDEGTPPDAQPVSPLGAFFAGHESQFEGVVFDLPQPAAFSANGTYNAFRVLEQDVFAFEAFLARAAVDSGLDAEMIAAKMCGRWRNGNPLPMHPDAAGPPATTRAARKHLNEYGYAADPDGDVCPIGSHMRRANPRDSEVVQRASAHTRRIIRRGFPYGPAIEPGTTTPDGTPRGLLGNFMCGSLIAQFEGIMYDWVNLGLQHPDITGTNDPILGANTESTSTFTMPRAGDTDTVLTGFPRFIRTRAGAYTFLPSLPGLRWLARPPSA